MNKEKIESDYFKKTGCYLHAHYYILHLYDPIISTLNTHS